MTTSTGAALLSALFFLATGAGVGLLSLVALVLWRRDRPQLSRRVALGAAGLTVTYLLVLAGAGLAGRGDVLLPQGTEKYFCEFDCHLAYSVDTLWRVGPAASGGTTWALSLVTRFDAATISPRRDRTAPLTPSPRRVELVATDGRSYPVTVATTGPDAGPASTDPMTPLRPGETYRTLLRVDLPAGSEPSRLYVGNAGFITALLVGDEASPFHGRVLLSLPGASVALGH